MRMSKEVEVDGPFGSSGKFMYVFGLVFVVVGVIAALMFFGIAHAAGEMLLGLGGLFILAIFGGVGGFIAYLGHKKMHENDAILSDGVEYQGKIYDYEPDYEILVNGQPCITLVVRYMDLGQVKEARVRTDTSNATPYPRGATVSIRIANGVAALVPGSVSNAVIVHQDDLMNRGFDPDSVAPELNVQCPNCGANVTVPVGMSRFCPYCNTKLTLDGQGRLV